MPQEGETLQIHSYKHDGHIHRVWQETIILSVDDPVVIGANKRTLVTESDGRTWLTREPAICYFHAEHWFNIICMLRKDGTYYYVNMGTPFLYENGCMKYIDYDLDFKVFPDMSYIVLDEDEYAFHRKKTNYPKELDAIMEKEMDVLVSWVKERKGPFAPKFIDRWTKKYYEQKE